MSEDGRPDVERNRYNIAGVQVANPSQKGDLAVGSASIDPTGRTISEQLSLPKDSQGTQLDGYVLTSDSSDSTFGLKWSAPIAQVTDTPKKLAGFSDPAGEIEAKDYLEANGNGLSIGGITKAKSVVDLESGQSGIASTKLTIQSTVGGNKPEDVSHIIDINDGTNSLNRQNRLVLNDRIGLQSNQSHGRYGNRQVVNLAVSTEPVSSYTYPTQYALAQFATRNTTTTSTVNARMIVLPANNLAQINALPTLLKQEYQDVDTSLIADGYSAGATIGTMHSQGQSLDMLADNGIAYCMEDDSYYVYSQSQDAFLKLTTASDVSAIGAMTVKESSPEALILTGGSAKDLEITGMFSFGQILKIEATGASSMSGNVSVRLEFYKDINMNNSDYTGQAEIIVEPSNTTYAYPSVTTEDSQSTGKVYVKVHNVSTNTNLDATIKIKGAGI